MPKIENGIANFKAINNYAKKISEQGKNYWGQVFDNFEAPFYDESKTNEVREKFIKWGQKTLAIAPSIDFNKEYNYRRK